MEGHLEISHGSKARLEAKSALNGSWSLFSLGQLLRENGMQSFGGGERL
jgi:hypothetical protein